MKTKNNPNVTEQPKRVARGSLRRMVQPTNSELSEAYAEAAQHLEMCACEEDEPLQKAAYNKVSGKLYKQSIAIAQRG